jgi:hypothetical protein
MPKKKNGKFDFEDVGKVKASTLFRDPNNPRKTTQLALQKLSASILEVGEVLLPLWVTPDAVIIDGNRRHKALEELDRLDMMVRVIVTDGDPDVVRATIHTGATQKRWCPHDQAMHFRQLLKTYTEKEATAITGNRPDLIRQRVEALRVLHELGWTPQKYSIVDNAVRYDIPMDSVVKCVDSGHVVMLLTSGVSE